MMIEPTFLALLACPVCDDRPPLQEDGETLVCPRGHSFPIVDGVPHLLPEDERSSAAEGVR